MGRGKPQKQEDTCPPRSGLTADDEPRREPTHETIKTHDNQHIIESQGKPVASALATCSAVWVVVQYDQCDYTDHIMQPGYWLKEHAEKRADRLNARETDSYTYRVKQIKMHALPNTKSSRGTANHPRW